MLLETAAVLVRKVLPPPPANMAELIKQAMANLNSYGIVGVVEPGIDERQINLYRALHDSGRIGIDFCDQRRRHARYRCCSSA